MNTNQHIGRVVIAGAGPGDPELITLKLQRGLGEADVIITDRLVNPLIIDKWKKPAAKVIRAGKQGFNEHSFTQLEVTALIVDHARQGKNVLRLKGGDVAFFSNILDELQAVCDHDIPFEVIPGITAASGASATAGIPLTARGYSQGVQFVTFHPSSYYSPSKWKDLAATNDTLVFYMAARNISDVAELLLRYSKRPQLPLAVIEQATTANQATHISTVGSCARDFAGKTFSSPSLVIVGEVVRLHERFNWFEKAQTAGSVFPELQPK
jgi:uroporphyrin-III C-methyltransferase